MNKFKKIIFAVAAVTSITLFSGCAAVKTLAATSSNWYVRTGHTGIQPTSVEGEQGFSKEVLTYSVSFNDQSAKNNTYEYKLDETAENYYKTTFYAKSLNWKSDDISEKYRTEKTETVYVLQTELKISGQYSLKSDPTSSVAFNDSIETYAYFRSAGDNLQPIKSYQKVESTSPASEKAATIEQLAEKHCYTVETGYNADCTEATVVTTVLGKEPQTEEVKLNKITTSLFDNTYFYFAVRAMGINDVNFSKTVANLIPVENGVTNFSVQTLSKNTLDSDQTQIKDALVAANYVSAESEVKYNRVGIASTNALAGGAQYAWFAAIENASSNTMRSTMLKLTVPLSYDLGALEYTLKNIESVLGAA